MYCMTDGDPWSVKQHNARVGCVHGYVIRTVNVFALFWKNSSNVAHFFDFLESKIMIFLSCKYTGKGSQSGIF